MAKLVREAAGLTKTEMARKLGQSRQTYHYFEVRNTSCTAQELTQLRRIFPGTDAEFLALVAQSAVDADVE